MLFKLAFRNVKRQISNYLIYFITVTLTVALIFAVNNIIFSELMQDLQEQYLDFLQPLLLSLSGLLSVIIAFVLSYVTAFLLRRRKQEFGLYLTMGMTRGNILAIFAGETAITFFLSLGFGMLLGLGLYQALMAIFINLLEMNYALGGYSGTAILITVAMVAVMFVISSLASLAYLRFAKISRLLGGDKSVEKTVKYPAVWLVVSAVAAGLLVGSLIWFSKWTEDIIDGGLDKGKEVIAIVIMFTASVIMLPTGFAKCVVPLCINHNEKKLSAKGTAVFTMRQLSGRLNANSIMAGVLTFLLLIAIILPNIFITMNTTIQAAVREQYPFDVRLSVQRDKDEYDYKDELEIIEQYADVKETCQYNIYSQSYKTTPDQNGYYFRYLVKESDYNKLCTMLGEETVSLNGKVIICREEDRYDNPDYNKFPIDRPIYIDGVEYSVAGEQKCLNNLLSSHLIIADFAVIPDSAVTDGETGLEVEKNFLAVTFKNARYNAEALNARMNDFYSSQDVYVSVDLQECERLYYVGMFAIWLLACIFVSVVFILLSMAMLALKMLSMLAEDKRRYKTLWRLGADDSMIFKSLFSQMFFFYFLPFALPFLLSGVLCAFLVKLAAKQGVTLSALALFGQVIGFTCIMLALYILYFTVTYLIARRDLKKSLLASQ